jgi:hypothetical protein
MTKTAISASLAVLMLAVTAGTSFASNVTTGVHLGAAGGAIRLGHGLVTTDPVAGSFVNAAYGDDEDEGDDDDEDDTGPVSAFDPEDGTFDEDPLGFEESTPASISEPLDDEEDDDEDDDEDEGGED